MVGGSLSPGEADQIWIQSRNTRGGTRFTGFAAVIIFVSGSRGYLRTPRLSNRQIDDRSGSGEGHIRVPHPLIVTESNKHETAEIGAEKATDLV